MYYGSIDVSKITKSKLYKGQKGTYANVTIWINDEVDNYGNIMSIIEGQTKEERETKATKNYLGNLKEHVSGQATAAPQSQQPQQPDDDSDLLPF